MSDTDKHQLVTGLAQLKLDYSAQQLDLLLAYAGLLVKWNRTHNLIGTRDSRYVISRHILDSLTLSTYLLACIPTDLPIGADKVGATDYSVLKRASVLDFGTGAGLPGLPLAILHPDYQFTLLDSSHKKTAFLHYCKVHLALTNITLACQRIETHKQSYTIIISRAASPIIRLIEQVLPRLDDGGIILAMLGREPMQDVIDSIHKKARVMKLDQVKSGKEQRHILVVKSDPAII